jgi:hypothetical protein
MAATAAIVAIFLPVAFMKGIIGAFFFQFGVTITVAVLLSLLEALTLTPSRSAQFLAVGKRTSWFGHAVEASFDGMAAAYKRALVPTLRHRWLVLGAGVAVFAASFWIAPKLRSEMTPSQDIGRVLATIKTPVGSSIDFTDERVRICEAMIEDRPEFPIRYVSIGGFQGGDVNTANVFVTMAPASERDVTMQQAMTEMRAKWNACSGVRAMIQDLDQGFTATRGYGVEFNVRGPDWNDSSRRRRASWREDARVGPLQDVDTDYQAGMPELQIRPTATAPRAMGVSMEGDRRDGQRARRRCARAVQGPRAATTCACVWSGSACRPGYRTPEGPRARRHARAALGARVGETETDALATVTSRARARDHRSANVRRASRSPTPSRRRARSGAETLCARLHAELLGQRAGVQDAGARRCRAAPRRRDRVHDPRRSSAASRTRCRCSRRCRSASRRRSWRCGRATCRSTCTARSASFCSWAS